MKIYLFGLNYFEIFPLIMVLECKNSSKVMKPLEFLLKGMQMTQYFANWTNTFSQKESVEPIRLSGKEILIK
jgi:hypothetical protein